MKFNWGTGIFIFLVLFIAAAAAFIIFASRQSVNLVNSDYYEKGTDFTNEMQLRERSARFESLITLKTENDSVRIIFPPDMNASIDSGTVIFFRPSDMKRDLTFPLTRKNAVTSVSGNGMLAGRYIIKLHWFTSGTDFAVDKELIIK